MRREVIEPALEIDVEFVRISQHSCPALRPERVLAIAFDHAVQLSDLLIYSHIPRLGGDADHLERAVVSEDEVFHGVNMLPQGSPVLGYRNGQRTSQTS